jgi:hypothetical protein
MRGQRTCNHDNDNNERKASILRPHSSESCWPEASSRHFFPGGIRSIFLLSSYHPVLVSCYYTSSRRPCPARLVTGSLHEGLCAAAARAQNAQAPGLEAHPRSGLGCWTLPAAISIGSSTPAPAGRITLTLISQRGSGMRPMMHGGGPPRRWHDPHAFFRPAGRLGLGACGCARPAAGVAPASSASGEAEARGGGACKCGPRARPWVRVTCERGGGSSAEDLQGRLRRAHGR